jgi:hypothetical protein
MPVGGRDGRGRFGKRSRPHPSSPPVVNSAELRSDWLAVSPLAFDSVGSLRLPAQIGTPEPTSCVHAVCDGVVRGWVHKSVSTQAVPHGKRDGRRTCLTDFSVVSPSKWVVFYLECMCFLLPFPLRYLRAVPMTFFYCLAVVWTIITAAKETARGSKERYVCVA